MKFIHLADLHLGKIIYQNNLLDIQIDLLNQVMNYMVQKKIDTLVIAGDVYDRAIASKESIVALNHFLETMILHYHKKVSFQEIMIAVKDLILQVLYFKVKVCILFLILKKK